MPEMPTFDSDGMLEIMTIMLIALGIFWGLNKAIHVAKR